MEGWGVGGGTYEENVEGGRKGKNMVDEGKKI